MDNRAEELIKIWQQRNISGFYSPGKPDALSKILEIIPDSASVGFSGSVTLEQLGVVKALEARGNKVYDHNQPGISRDDSLALRRQAAQNADYYLASANAISQSGELVFLSAWGNRTSGVSYAKNTIIVAGVNKIAPNLNEALKRAKEYATPLNYQRLNWPKDKPMCCQVLIIEAEVAPGRLKVVLVGDSLGF